MLTEAQKLQMPEHFLRLYESGKVDEALSYLQENWLIYPHLPAWVFDNEQISAVAIGKHSYLSRKMSERLQRNVLFFEKVFNRFSPYAKIFLKTGRDSFFMLAYANAVHGYTKAAEKLDVANLFPEQDIEAEYEIAQRLILEIGNWRKRILLDKQQCSQLLSEVAPGLAEFCYEYAYYWEFRESANAVRSQYW